jgi:Kef-type K+ transport system membrane component KefB/Trk K+ transport system NAD-binding subunit
MQDGQMFNEFALILLIAGVIAFVGSLLRQPLIVSFLFAGILVGPSGFGIVTSHEQMELFAEFGIAILLFIVGLKLDLHTIRTMGAVAVATGLGQVIFTSFFGFLIALALGFELVPAIYIAVALTYSSTIIIVKLLSDKREIDSLHGRIAVGFLIVQDICVILSLIALSALGAGVGAESSLVFEVVRVAVTGLLMLVGVLLLIRYVIPPVAALLARSQELLVLFSIAWAVALAAACDVLGFSKEVGAFLAGVSLGSTVYRESIATRLVTLRDFLLLFFFIDLGSRLELSLLGANVVPAIIFSVFVLVGNPIIVMIIMGLMGYRKRTSFLAGLAVAQISEFSLIFATLGVSLGHLDEGSMGLITLVGLITIGLSTYMIIYSGPLYNVLSPWLGIFERKSPRAEEEDSGRMLGEADMILFGLGDYGGHIARLLLGRGNRLIGVDFDPQVLGRWQKVDGIQVLYGDVEDPEILEHLPMESARWVIATVPSREATVTLLNLVRQSRRGVRFVATVRNAGDEEVFLRAGADVVLNPFEDAAEQAVDSLAAVRHSLPGQFLWPTSISELRLESGSVFAGKRLADIPLRSETGATILAITRAGRSTFDPGPDFVLYPGDRVVLLGDKKHLDQAAVFLGQREYGRTDMPDEERFTVAAYDMDEGGPWSGKTIAEANIRRQFGVTIIGIEREGDRLTNPAPTETIQVGDKLVVAGSATKVQAMGAFLEV